LQDFGDCVQSSQIGPHLVQPSSASAMAITLDINSSRRISANLSPKRWDHGPQVRHFQAKAAAFDQSPRRRCSLRRNGHYNAPTTITGEEPAFMQQQPQAAEFGIAEANRVLGEVFAPWVQDLNLSIEGFDFAPPANAADWQPGAILRMPFSERLCRNGGIVCGQALMAFADTSMVIANLAANKGYRPMTTVDQTTHFMRAVTASDVLADARVVRLGRTMSFGRVTLLGATDNKPVAMVSSAFAMLPS
jgi:uncharacterized protein (TIGR00369 family)